MNKYLYIILTMILVCHVNLSAQTFTKTYYDEPMPNVLRDINNAYTDGNIHFIFNELEDYTVTTTIINKPILDAIYEVIGFYPIKVTRDANDIFIECWQKEENKLKGRLIDEHRNPVEFANVSLFNPIDSTFITGGVTNQNGDFVIPTNAKTVLLRTRCIGYMPYSKVYNVGNIGTVHIHSNAKLLKEVLVEQKQISYDGDKIITHPTATQVKHSADLYSLLGQQPFPGLFVDEINRSIKVFNGAPIILVDGIKRSASELISINSKNIAKFEYSPNVPLKYLDSGASGIIYVYLKQPKDGGTFYGNITGAPTTGFINADAGASYNQGKSEFTLDYSFNWRDYDKREVDIEESYIGDDFRVDITKDGKESPMDYNQHSIITGYTYRHDKSLTFSAKLRNYIWTNHSKEYSNVTDSYLGNYSQIESDRGYKYAPSLDLFIKKEWNNGQSIEAQVVGSLSDSEQSRDLNNDFATDNSEIYSSVVNSNHKSLITEISYSKQFGKKTQLSAGFQNSLNHTSNNYILNEAKTTLSSNNNYIYAGLTQRIGKSVLNIGSGLKMIWMESEDNKRNFTRNLSYLSFGLPIDQKFQINFSGRYTPSIPSLHQLTNVEQEYDGYLVTNGNPNLKCRQDLFGRLQGHFSHNRFSASIGAEYMYMIDPTYLNFTYLGNGKFIALTDNFDNYKRLGIYANITMREIFNKHLSFNIYCLYNHMTSIDDAWHYSLDGFTAQFSVNAYFGNWGIRAYYKIPDQYLFGDEKRKNENWSTLTIGYRPNKQWYFSLTGNLLFHSAGTEYPNWKLSATNPKYTYVSIQNNANMITFTARYNISFGRIFGKTKRSLNNSDSGPAVLTL